MLRRAWRRPALRALGLAALVALATVGLTAAGHGLRSARAAGAQHLPHLVADPPEQVGSVNPETPPGEGTELLLRFNGYVHNNGTGALDFRGSRKQPEVSPQVMAQVEHAREHEENLPQKIEEKLKVPPMKVFQRVFSTPIGVEENNIERQPHADEPSSGEMEYVSADGHHHWHLQRIARYSLWNKERTAQVAPAEKVGFCLEDSEHRELSKGPLIAAYAEPARDFCQKYRPNATSLYEGISPGWRDRYGWELSFQWVDVSETPPGEYWLREDVNPLGYVKEESGEGERAAYAASLSVVGGFDAEPESLQATGEPRLIPLHFRRYQVKGKPSGEPQYSIVSQPRHGKVELVNSNTARYTPTGRYTGPDSFTYSARDPASEFPRRPVIATVAIEGETPTLAISGAQERLYVGTSAALTALVGHDAGGVEWTASNGSFTSGVEGLTTVYKAPGEAGNVTLTARLRDDPEVSAQVTIAIVPVPPQEPAPVIPAQTSTPTTTSGVTPAVTPSSGSAGYKAETKPGVSRPRAMWFGRYLVMTTTPTVAGRVRLTAYRGRYVLGTCSTLTPGGHDFTCRLKPGAAASRRTRISVLASLRVGSQLINSWLPTGRIPEMKMKPVGKGARIASGGHVYWCSPSTLVPTLAGGEE